MVATVVAVPLAWLLMQQDVWIPILVGLGFILFGMILLLGLPETLYRLRPFDPIHDDDRSSEHEESADPKTTNVVEIFKWSRFVFTSPLLCIMALTFLVQSLTQSNNHILLQLASQRFDWSFANVCTPAPIHLALRLTGQSIG